MSILFVVSIFLIFSKTATKGDIENEIKVPLAIFQNFRALEIDGTGIKYNILGKDVKYYQTKKEFNEIILSKDNQTIYAKSGFFENDRLILTKNIRYSKDNDNFRFNGAYIDYNTSNKKIVAKDIQAIFKE